jgi:MYXO-CTERM domain-containing protein
LDQAIVIKYTITGAVKGVDFDAQSTVTIPAGSPTRSADLIINPTADGTATSLTLTITDDSAYSTLLAAKSVIMTLTAAPTVDPNDPTKDKPKPGSVDSGSSGGCGMGSGFAALAGLGLFALFAFRRRSL